MKNVVAVRGLFDAARKINDAPSSLCCDYCRGKLSLNVHRYWRMRFCSAACTIPTTTVSAHAAENRRDRSLFTVVERGELNATNWRKLVQRSVSNRVTPDRSKIAVTSEDEIKYWIKHLGVTREVLERAVERVGNSAASVRKELRNLALDSH
jgi:hypothetical protein